MANASRINLLVVCATALSVAAGLSIAQTPAQMEYERQQREYWRQQEQQRQEQQRQQQLMQENARRQQGEASRIDAPSGGAAGGGWGGAAGQGADPGNAAAWTAARAKWEKRPPLAPEDNPLLGTWTRPADPAAKSSDPFGSLAALMKGGMCEVLFGGGMFEFRRGSLVGRDQHTPEQELDKVEYRGGGKHVAVLPKTTVKLIEFDFDTPDRVHWTAQPNCVLVRVKAASRSAAAPATNAPATASAAGNASPGGVLSLFVGAPSADNHVAGRKLWVLKEDAQVALIKGGITNTPYGTVLQTWIRACTAHAPTCQQGALALKPYSVGLATTDATGHAHTPPLPAGRYWVLSDAKVANKHLVWNQPVDVRTGDKVVTLDERNALPVD